MAIKHTVVLIDDGESTNKKDVPDSIYLDKNAHSNIFIYSTDILFLTKLQNEQTLSNEFAHLISKNTNFLKLCQSLINCETVEKV